MDGNTIDAHEPTEDQPKESQMDNEQDQQEEESFELRNDEVKPSQTVEQPPVEPLLVQDDQNHQQEEESVKIIEEPKEKHEKLVHKHVDPPIERDKSGDHTQLEQKPRVIVKHSILGNRIPSHDPNVLVESTTFTSIGKIQPFLITMATNAALVMDFHCHLTTSEVVGYLAGNWDVNSHNLHITHAFPCKCRLGDYESAPLVENEIRKLIKSNRLTLIGWYHSHPTAPATPSLRDIDTQLDYELRMKGNSDSTYLPCIGVICSPYNVDNPSYESNIVSYWVIPPPETKVHEYGKPMIMSYSIVQDQSISHEVLLEMKKCADFYKPEKDFIRFNECYKGATTYLEKLKSSLTSKFPLNQHKTGALWTFILDVIAITNEKSETEILKEIIEISSAPTATVSNNDKPKFSVPNTPPPLGFKSTTSSTGSGTSTGSGGGGSNNNSTASNLPYQKSHSRSKSSSNRRPSSREGKSLASLSNYFVGSDLSTALFGSGKFPMGLDPATKSLLNLNSLSLGNMFLPPMAAYKPEPNMGLMKPPPPPSTYYPYASQRSSSSRTSPSSSRSQSRNLPSTSRDMPPPNKVPKLDVHQMANFFIPPNLGRIPANLTVAKTGGGGDSAVTACHLSPRMTSVINRSRIQK